MRLNLILKSYFFKFISNHKTMFLDISDSPKFLILMHQNISDIIFCSSILREIKKTYPASNLQVLASEANNEIVLVNPYIDKVYVYKNRWNKLLSLLINLRNNMIVFKVWYPKSK